MLLKAPLLLRLRLRHRVLVPRVLLHLLVVLCGPGSQVPARVQDVATVLRLLRLLRQL